MNLKSINSCIIACLVVLTGLLVIFPLEIPRTANAISHGGAGSPGPYAAAEDGVLPWDADGTVNGMVVWADIDNPHIIENFDYVVNASYTLFIAPGCEVRFNAGLSLVLEPGINPAELDADGAGAGITFTSNTGSNPGDWGCIHAGFGTLISSMSDCVVEYSTDGVYVDNGIIGNPLEDCEFRYNSNFGLYLNATMGIVDVNNNYIYNNTRGIYLRDQMGGPMVSSNHIYNCEYGISSISSSLQLQGNDIYNNDYGVVLNLSTFSVAPSIILNNIMNNTMDGVLVEGEGPSIDRNVISNNGRHGINATPDPVTGARPLISVMGNDIISNSGHGIYSFNSTNVWINSNDIYDNKMDGVYILSDSGPTGAIDISDNEILNNSRGLYIRGENPLIQDNYIALNKDHGIYACDDPLYGPTSPQIFNNTLENNTEAGIWIDGLEPTIQGGTILNSTYGIYVEADADPWIEDVWIENSTKLGWGIELHDSKANITNTTITNFRFGIRSFTSDVNIYRSRLEDWGLVGILSLSASTVLVENSTMSSPGPQHFNIAQGSQVTTLNTTFDKSKVIINLITSKFTVKWWVHIKVNESDGDPAIGSQTWLNDTFKSTIYTGSTDSQGWIKWVKVTEYTQDVFGKVLNNTHIATTVNDSEKGITYTDIESYQIIYIDLGTVKNFPISLQNGWNMISVPVNLSDTSIGSVFSGVNYKVVQHYNASDSIDHWKYYNVEKVPPFINDLTDIDKKIGLWIYMNQSEMLRVTGGFPYPTTISLKKGWNLVGFPSLSSRALGDVGLPVECSLVMLYNASSGQWEDNNPITPFTQISYMRPGEGYWLHVTDDVVWSVS